MYSELSWVQRRPSYCLALPHTFVVMDHCIYALRSFLSDYKAHKRAGTQYLT